MGAVLLFAIPVIIYRRYNPMDSAWFPKCPFLSLTGLQCPGCGSQRAIHNLLNLDIVSAFKDNMLLVLSIPYLITGFVFESIASPGPGLLKWRKAMFGQKAIWVIFMVVIAFWILRNLL